MSLQRPGRGRGGKGGSEPTARVRLREAQALEHMNLGRTQHEIARMLGVSQPAVSKMLRRIEERLLTEQAMKVERQRARHTARLEFIYAQAIGAWQASQSETVRRRQRKTEGQGATGDALLSELVSENRHGDPRYLEEARRALEDIRKIWGVNAPASIAIDATTPYALMSDDALKEAIVEKARIVSWSVSPDPGAEATPKDATRD